jgi:hypothetical protein
MLLLLGCAAMANAQQPICKTYKKLLTSSSNKLLMDPIRVPHSAPIASVVVNSMSVAFPKIGDLQVSSSSSLLTYWCQLYQFQLCNWQK